MTAAAGDRQVKAAEAARLLLRRALGGAGVAREASSLGRWSSSRVSSSTTRTAAALRLRSDPGFALPARLGRGSALSLRAGVPKRRAAC